MGTFWLCLQGESITPTTQIGRRNLGVFCLLQLCGVVFALSPICCGTSDTVTVFSADGISRYSRSFVCKAGRFSADSSFASVPFKDVLRIDLEAHPAASQDERPHWNVSALFLALPLAQLIVLGCVRAAQS